MKRRTGYNKGFTKVAVQCSADTFVINQSLVLRINPPLADIENRRLRQAHKRYTSSYDDQRQLTNKQKYAYI